MCVRASYDQMAIVTPRGACEGLGDVRVGPAEWEHQESVDFCSGVSVFVSGGRGGLQGTDSIMTVSACHGG